MNVAFDAPRNARILRYLARDFARRGGRHDSAPPTVYDLFRDPLGTHPDLADRLWRELGGTLPEPCAWVVYARPVLVHPSSGVVFGFAWGTHTYALRLPEPELTAATQLGMKRLPLGEPWTLGAWHADEPAWCLAAYRAAGVARTA